MNPIIEAVRAKGFDVGDSAMIAEGEYGYWVGCSIYVSKNEVNSFITKAYEAKEGAR